MFAFKAAGTPLAVRYDGRVWAVAVERLHWFTRDTSTLYMLTAVATAFLSYLRSSACWPLLGCLPSGDVRR
jgi:hypothetical protein